MSDYYDIDKPFSRKNWNKLIRDLNEFFSAPTEGCPDIEPLDEVEPGKIWTLQDVQEIRDKLKEACPLNFRDDIDYYDLNKPWHKQIIDEIEEAMIWCNCGVQVIDEVILPYMVLCKHCGYDWEPLGPTIGEVYGGSTVAPPNFVNRRWQYGMVTGPDEIFDFTTFADGPVSCEGVIEDEVDWKGAHAFDTKTRQIAIPVGFGFSPYCAGRWPCTESAQALYDGYQAEISQYDPETIQLRLTSWVVEFEKCEEEEV